jgi:hypothetical protein
VSVAMSFSCDHGVVSSTNSTYLHADMPKINSSYFKICERRLARVSPASRPCLAQKFSISNPRWFYRYSRYGRVCQKEVAFLLHHGNQIGIDSWERNSERSARNWRNRFPPRRTVNITTYLRVKKRVDPIDINIIICSTN